MQLNHGCHLAYCTNVHPAESWAETFAAIERHTLAVKKRICPHGRYAIGLRLSDLASRELADSTKVLEFQRWLDKHECYIFTINGFPFGEFHGTRVKEHVYLPDWTSPERLDYTNRLFDLLAQLVPHGIEGSVSTVPGSFKEFIRTPEQLQFIRNNVWRCVEHIARMCELTGRNLHLGLEPEPLGLLENSIETAEFFDRLRDEHPGDPRLDEHLGVNYDTCHFAVEFEEPHEAVARLQNHRIRLSKIHVSNALKLRPTQATLSQLAAFADDVYLHQVIMRHENGSLTRYKDLDLALNSPLARNLSSETEWRVHFHVPLRSEPSADLETTADHVVGLLQLLQTEPKLCTHLEMETYTWAVLPEAMKSRSVVEQLVGEYDWMLRQLRDHGFVQ